MKTFIRRPGNKTKHLKHIIHLLPKEYNTYIEPFVGTGALFLHLLPEKWIINDLNKDIANIWKLVRDDPEYLISQIDSFEKSFLSLNNGDKIQKCKKITSSLENLKGKKRTVAYLLMVYCSFSSSIERDDKFIFDGLYKPLYLTNSCHVFSQKYKIKIRELSKNLKNGKINNVDYSEVLKKAKKGDFVFLDPPYIEEKKYSFQYNRNDLFDIKRLKKELEYLDKRGVKWMMTQVNTKDTVFFFKKYNQIVSISNSGIVDKNRNGELIITNY